MDPTYPSYLLGILESSSFCSARTKHKLLHHSNIVTPFIAYIDLMFFFLEQNSMFLNAMKVTRERIYSSNIEKQWC